VHVGTQHFERSDANLLMSAVSRRIVAGQDFGAIVRARRRNYLHLDSLLRDLRTPVFAGLPDGVCPLFYPFTTPRKPEVWSRLRGKGIQAVTFWMTTTVKRLSARFPATETLRRTVLELPCHQDMTPQLIEHVAQEVRAVVRELDA
jgi:dTDP-4-amino-4,6-dideoxygalactose transaminase